MTAPPVEYQHPVEDECDVQDLPVSLNPDERLAINIWFFNKRIVRFCVELRVRHFDEWREVVRVDTCHGVVHRHELTALNGETKVIIARLPGDDDEAAWKILGQQYEAAHADLTTRCDHYIQKWRTT